jgi:hypothetical protein
MNTSENQREEKPKYGCINKGYLLLPEHADWLKRKGKSMQRTASSILRDLIKEAMASDEKKPN